MNRTAPMRPEPPYCDGGHLWRFPCAIASNLGRDEMRSQATAATAVAFVLRGDLTRGSHPLGLFLCSGSGFWNPSRPLQATIKARNATLWKGVPFCGYINQTTCGWDFWNNATEWVLRCVPTAGQNRGLG